MHSSHATSTIQALYRVFILPSLAKNQLQPRRSHLPNLLQQQPQHLQSRRPFSHTTPLKAKTRPAEERAQKWNEEITSRVIYLIDPETNLLIDEPRQKFDILNNLDTKTHRLVQLSPDEPENLDFIPVCKIVSKKESYDAEKKRKAQARESKKLSKLVGEVARKTLELNWAIDGNDLGHRLERLKEFLEEGRRVEVVFASKKRGRKATLEECEDVLKRVRQTVDGVEGAKEREALQGKIGGVAQILFQGRPVKDVKGDASAADADADAEQDENEQA